MSDHNHLTSKSWRIGASFRRTSGGRASLPASVPMLIAVLSASLSSACSLLRTPLAQDGELPTTLGEQNSGYSYIPLDPLPVRSESDVTRQCRANSPVTDWEPIPEALPDNSVRIAVGQFDVSGNLTFGPLQIGTSGNTYQVVLDYINVDTSNVYFDVGYRVGEPRSGPEVRSLYEVRGLPSEANLRVVRFDPDNDDYTVMGDVVVIPVYVGLGLRLTATLTVIEGTVDLSSLIAIAADADARRVAGSLVVQTLGITGSEVTTSLPLPSELSAASIQQGILALGSIKARIYEQSAIKNPRVTGIYNPLGIGDPRLINAIVSELAREPIRWKRPCRNFESRTGGSA